MAGSLDSFGPSYISAHSANVILSEIRPIELKIETLQSINVFLDEFLSDILKTAHSLLTDNLRTSLLSLLPTTLGKEALLEAEVELRAYWDRTPTPDAGTLEDDSEVFHFQWAFELLRLKCEAYSTLNQFDGDQTAESRTNYIMSATGGTPPKAALIAPAALYLTAILESLCEHILSNVGRVVARDSSRTNATAQDLFIALCEDHTIYDLFKKMKVYEQIEQLSKPPRVRRSKSLTRNEKPSRTSSPQQDMSSNKDTTSEAPVIAANTGSTATGNPGSRSSFEKTRTIKMFKPSTRSSGDGDVPNSHKRSNSSISEKSSRYTTTLIDDSIYENNTLQQEFDDLMRSSSTMKVSLTPDRLKTMEMYKQEKERGNRRGVVSESESSPVPLRVTGRRPSLLHRVDSIKEDEEESGKKPPLATTRNRQASVSSRPSTAPTPSRLRSISTSGSSAASRLFGRPSHTSTPALVHPTTDQSPMQKPHYITKVQDPSLPPRTRKLQRTRESLDLDEVMAGSEDDEFFPSAPVSKLSARPAAATPRRNGQNPSENTRDLIDFLAEGPPDIGGPISRNTTDGPLYGTSQNGKPKGTGRLQRMISKLSLGNGDRSRATDDISRLPAPQTRTISSQSSLINLANRPAPPRPPPASRHISSPESPHDSSEDHSYTAPRLRSASVGQPKLPLDAGKHREPVSLPTVRSSPVPREYSRNVSPSHENGHVQQSFNVRRQQHVDTSGLVELQRMLDTVQPVEPPQVASSTLPTSPTPPTSSIRKPPPVYVDPITQPHISHEDALHMHRLFSKATTADECRLILDMFLARIGVLVPKTIDAPHPLRDQTAALDPRLEASLLELLLSGESATTSDSNPKPAQENLKSITLFAEPAMPQGNDSMVKGDFSKESSIAQQEAAQFAQIHYPVPA